MSRFVSGVLEGISDVRKLSDGVFKKGPNKGKPFTMYGIFLTVDGVSYSLTGFNKETLVSATKECVEKRIIEFEYNVNGDYNNIDLKKEINVFNDLVAGNKSFSKTQITSENTPQKDFGENNDSHVSAQEKDSDKAHEKKVSVAEREILERIAVAVEKVVVLLETRERVN